MAKEIKQNFEFTRNWEDHDDFPTIQNSERVVREDIQSLPDELKNFLNTIIIPTINTLASRIASLGGDGMVEHESIAEDAIGTENIIDGSITQSKYAPDSIPAGVLKEESVSNDCIPDGELSTDKISEVELNSFIWSSMNDSFYDDLIAISEYPVEDGAMGHRYLVRVIQQVVRRTDIFRLGVTDYIDELNN